MYCCVRRAAIRVRRLHVALKLGDEGKAVDRNERSTIRRNQQGTLRGSNVIRVRKFKVIDSELGETSS